jgi:hypothetical protein
MSTEPVHAPLPLHVPGVVSMPFAHEALTHTVAGPYFAHAPALHVPSVPQLVAAVIAQRWCGSTAPSLAAPQVPSAPLPLSAAEQA